jgi:trans-2,3-dihydro-3-hydroxyanthranilate isomerase
VGLPFVVAELASRAALERARPNPARFSAGAAAYPQLHGDFALFVYVVETPDRLSARMFAPLDGVPEDPATGSASAALAAYRAVLSGQRDGEQTLLIEQGVDMGRPSTIHLRVRLAAGQAQHVLIAGECVPVMQGTIALETKQ